MNDDEIERLLRELPSPALPEAWRTGILAEARRQSQAEKSPHREWPPILLWLRNVCARNPVSVSALAALWLLIFLFRVTTPVDLQEQEILAHADRSQPVRLITMADEIRLVEIAEETREQPQPIP